MTVDMTVDKTMKALLAMLGLIVSSCATQHTSVRASYLGPDNVDSANANCLVGTWRARQINPIENQTPQDSVMEYRSDGTVTATLGGAQTSQATQHPVPNPKPKTNSNSNDSNLLITGNWTLQNDLITHSNIKMQSLGSDEISLLLSELINHAGHELGGTANIYELSANRMVTVGTDGVAIEYFRIIESDTGTSAAVTPDNSRIKCQNNAG